jgi:hypothetical protein
MVKARVDAMYIYGFWKTGILILTPWGSEELPEDRLKIWDEAICEYMDLTFDGFVIEKRQMM